VDLMTANQQFRLPEGLDRVSARVLAVCGAGEYRAMRLSASDIAAAIPGAQVRAVRYAEKLSLAQQHNWNMTAPELFTQMVRAWVTGRELPPELAEIG
jgi:hypothetical protein